MSYQSQFQFNMGPKRPNKPNDQILAALDAAAVKTFGPGTRLVIFSGQEGDLPQHGSNRHKTGLAADLKVFRPDGTLVRLKDNDAKNFAQNALGAGVLGIGAGEGYMGDAFHMDMVPHENYSSNQRPFWGNWAKANLSEANMKPLAEPGILEAISNNPRQPGAAQSQGRGQNIFDAMAVGFNSMRLTPDQGLAQMLNNRMTNRRAMALEAQKKNRTLEWLSSQEGGEMYAAALEAGADPSSVVTSFISQQQKSDNVVVGNKIIDRNTGEVVYESKAGFRPATAEEAAQYGALAGQIDIANGKFHPTRKPDKKSEITVGPDGTVRITEGGDDDDSGNMTTSNRTQFQKIEVATKGIFTSLDTYEGIFNKGGSALLPGTQRDGLIATRRALQLQMKELFNLGVLNGPDLDLMDELMVDVTSPVNIGLDALGIASLEDRFDGNMVRIRKMMNDLKDSWDVLSDPEKEKKMKAAAEKPEYLFKNETRTSTPGASAQPTDGPTIIKKF